MSMKATYQEKLQAKLEEWNTEIERLTEKAAEVEATAQDQYKEEIEDLQARQQEVQAKLDELQQSGEGAWEDIKAGVEMSKTSLEESLKSAKARFQ